MILPFSTKLNGKPTYFVEKIHVGLRIENKVGICEDYYTLNYNFIIKRDCNPKIHTIREDKNDRWKVGTKIDFFINCRQKDMFRFAPVLPVVSVQEVFMTYSFNNVIEISVDDTYINNILQFAVNDGFDNWEDFFNFFYPKIMANPDKFYKGKIIHWTDLRY